MIRIGTRKSKLALWQAETVQTGLRELGHEAVLCPMSSKGDLIQDKALHQIGGTGLFTKVLDDALLRKEIDVAVHSLKDYPTQIPEGLSLAAVLPRASALDMLVYKGEPEIFSRVEAQGTIATGSPRRKAQWLHAYPNFSVVGLRGNVPTRLQKLADSDYNGAIFAQAGIERLGLHETMAICPIVLGWMVPAPAQGIIAIVCREEDQAQIDILRGLNDEQSLMAAQMEREFLRQVEGGCSAPVGAYLEIGKDGKTLRFRGRINSLDGKKQVDVEEKFSRSDLPTGTYFADQILAKGGAEILEEIRQIENTGLTAP